MDGIFIAGVEPTAFAPFAAPVADVALVAGIEPMGVIGADCCTSAAGAPNAGAGVAVSVGAGAGAGVGGPVETPVPIDVA
jgi:hypothetical protein